MGIDTEILYQQIKNICLKVMNGHLDSDEAAKQIFDSMRIPLDYTSEQIIQVCYHPFGGIAFLTSKGRVISQITNFKDGNMVSCYVDITPKLFTI